MCAHSTRATRAHPAPRWSGAPRRSGAGARIRQSVGRHRRPANLTAATDAATRPYATIYRSVATCVNKPAATEARVSAEVGGDLGELLDAEASHRLGRDVAARQHRPDHAGNGRVVGRIQDGHDVVLAHADGIGDDLDT